MSINKASKWSYVERTCTHQPNTPVDSQLACQLHNHKHSLPWPSRSNTSNVVFTRRGLPSKKPFTNSTSCNKARPYDLPFDGLPRQMVRSKDANAFSPLHKELANVEAMLRHLQGLDSGLVNRAKAITMLTSYPSSINCLNVVFVQISHVADQQMCT